MARVSELYRSFDDLPQQQSSPRIKRKAKSRKISRRELLAEQETQQALQEARMLIKEQAVQHMWEQSMKAKKYTAQPIPQELFVSPDLLLSAPTAIDPHENWRYSSNLVVRDLSFYRLQGHLDRYKEGLSDSLQQYERVNRNRIKNTVKKFNQILFSNK